MFPVMRAGHEHHVLKLTYVPCTKPLYFWMIHFHDFLKATDEDLPPNSDISYFFVDEEYNSVSNEHFSIDEVSGNY